MKSNDELALQEQLTQWSEEKTAEIELHWNQVNPLQRTDKRWRWAWLLAPVAAVWLWQVIPTQAPVYAPPAALDSTPMLLAGNYSLDRLDRQIQHALVYGDDEQKLQQWLKLRQSLQLQEQLL